MLSLSAARLVALDTQVFHRSNFDYESKLFKSLISLTEAEKIELYLTCINHQEILSQINKKAEELYKTLSNIKKELRTVKISSANNFSIKPLLDSLNTNFPKPEDIKQVLLDNYNEFLRKAKIEILSIEDVDVNDIFSKYFQGLPPFNSGKKKSEFPDAFTLLALELKAEEMDKVIYVVSGDEDWKGFCENHESFYYFETLEKLLNYFIEEDNPDDLEICSDALDENFDLVEEKITEQFIELDFYIDVRSQETMFEWDSEKVEVEVSQITLINSSIIDIDDSNPDNPLVTFDLEVEIDFDAEIEYRSLEKAIYDVGEDTFLGGEMIEETINDNVTASVEVSMSFTRDRNYTLEFEDIVDVVLDPSGSISIIEISVDCY